MEIYHYHSITNEYVGKSQARKSPKDDEWLIPAYATTIPAPEVQSGCIMCFEDGCWIQKADLRGKYIYRKDNGYDKVLVDFIGDPPGDFTIEPPPDRIRFPIWNGMRWTENPVEKEKYGKIMSAIKNNEAVDKVRDQVVALNFPKMWNEWEEEINNAESIEELKKTILKGFRVLYMLGKYPRRNTKNV